MRRRILLVAVAVPQEEQLAYDLNAKNILLAPSANNVIHFCNADTPKGIELIAKDKRSNEIYFHDLTRKKIEAIVKHLKSKFPPGRFTFYALGKTGIADVTPVTSFIDLTPNVKKPVEESTEQKVAA
jgi:hypothetical protein